MKRAQRNLARRTKIATLGSFSTLDRFDWNHPSTIDRPLYGQPLSLEFLRQGNNVLLRGPSSISMPHPGARRPPSAGHRSENPDFGPDRQIHPETLCRLQRLYENEKVVDRPRPAPGRYLDLHHPHRRIYLPPGLRLARLALQSAQSQLPAGQESFKWAFGHVVASSVSLGHRGPTSVGVPGVLDPARETRARQAATAESPSCARPRWCRRSRSAARPRSPRCSSTAPRWFRRRRRWSRSSGWCRCPPRCPRPDPARGR